MTLEVYSDGSATISSKPGGFGWVLVLDGAKLSEGNGFLPAASNNDAELRGAIAGLTEAFRVSRTMPEQAIDVTLVSDSQVILGWANGSYRCKSPEKQLRVTTLQELVRRLSAKTKWVKGHSGHVWNERCDELANLGRMNLPPSETLQKKTTKRAERTIKTRKTEIVIECNGEPYAVNFSSMTVVKLEK